MPFQTEQERLLNRREAIQRVTAMLGGIALVGGSALLTGCRDEKNEGSGEADATPTLFSDEEIAYLDEIAETILPETETPGAKAAGVGAFMAVMVTDTYEADEQQAFRNGMDQLNEACQQMHGTSFMEATPEQRLALLEQLDQEQMDYMAARAEVRRQAEVATPADTTAMPADTTVAADSAQADAFLPDQRQENTTGADASAAPAITADSPAHYFRMMKELTLLGYFTSEIGYTQAMRYNETPGRFDPCVPYAEGDKAWAPHA
ncbi:MAG TPA: gluconate 2-dehydrogenase subunit 3 family protein [Rhodothermales bacterium]|nr:gluconate 2-dehydrogenase subunit 3 family protein [Rhodothermales bacterium]